MTLRKRCATSSGSHKLCSFLRPSSILAGTFRLRGPSNSSSLSAGPPVVQESRRPPRCHLSCRHAGVSAVVPGTAAHQQGWFEAPGGRRRGRGSSAHFFGQAALAHLYLNGLLPLIPFFPSVFSSPAPGSHPALPSAPSPALRAHLKVICTICLSGVIIVKLCLRPGAFLVAGSVSCVRKLV